MVTVTPSSKSGILLLPELLLYLGISDPSYKEISASQVSYSTEVNELTWTWLIDTTGAGSETQVSAITFVYEEQKQFKITGVDLSLDSLVEAVSYDNENGSLSKLFTLFKNLDFEINYASSVADLTFAGTGGDDIVKFGKGDDSFFLDGGKDAVDMGDGNDAIYMYQPYYKGDTTIASTIDGGKGTDALYFRTANGGDIESQPNKGVIANFAENLYQQNDGITPTLIAHSLKIKNVEVVYGTFSHDVFLDANSMGKIYGGNGFDQFVVNAAVKNSSGQYYGEDGADTFDAFDTGAKVTGTFYGGLESDWYNLYTTGWKIVEKKNEGDSDNVHASFNYVLPDNVENLALNSGEDVIKGGGNSGNNNLLGNDNANILYGDIGNDILQGGKGADKLYGGTAKADDGKGNDIFTYASQLESNAQFGIDTIYGNFTGHDRIHLLSLTPTTSSDTLVFVGFQDDFVPFAGALHLVQVSKKLVDVEVYLNGDDIPDFQLHLVNPGKLDVTDFVL